MSPDNTTKMPIVFVHGLWLHAESWNPWIEFFHENGYDAIAASWRGDAATTEATRQNADAVAGYGVTEIADHIAKQIKKLDRGHSLVLDSGWRELAEYTLGWLQSKHL